MAKRKTLIFKRSGVRVVENGHSRKPIGMMGTLRIEGTSLEYVTLERGGNYVRLPKGRFELHMHRYGKLQSIHVMSKGKRGHNVPTLAGGLAQILIHQASLPHQLTGCIAPGRPNPGAGPIPIVKSGECMKELIEQLGGFRINWMRPCGYIVVE